MLDLGHGGCSRCCGTKSAHCRTPAAPQLTRSQGSTKQTTDRSRSWHRHVWKCWAGCSQCGHPRACLLGAGGCRQTTVGSQMLMVARLLLAWAGTNLPARPIRKTSEEGSAKYHLQLSLDGHTFRAEMSSLSADNNTYQTLPTMFVNLPGWSGTLSIS